MTLTAALTLTAIAAIQVSAPSTSQANSDTIITLSVGEGAESVEASAALIIDKQESLDEIAPEQTARYTEGLVKTYASEIKRVDAGNGAVNLELAKSRKVGPGQYALSFPIQGEAIVAPSNITLFIDSTGVKHQEEQIFTALDAHSGRAQYWTDGVLKMDKIANDEGAISDTTDIALVRWSFKKFNECLANAGVSAWVVTLISAGCSIACAVTFGAGCIACIAAISFVSGATLGACAALARR
jgi:hypothetical protein